MKNIGIGQTTNISFQFTNDGSAAACCWKPWVTVKPIKSVDSCGTKH